MHNSQAGPPAGAVARPPILIVHPYPAYHDAWTGVRETLRERGYECHELGFPGWTGDLRVRPGELLDGYQDATRAEIARLGGRPLLVGAHTGGLVALRIGEQQSSAIAGVVALSPAGFGMSSLARLAAYRPVAIALRLTAQALPDPVRVWAACRAYRGVNFHEHGPAADMASFADAARGRGTAGALITRGTSLLREVARVRAPEPDPRCPTLLIATLGRITQDRYPKPRPGLTVVAIHAGHSAHVERPRQIAKLIADHARSLGEHPAAPGDD